MAVEYICDRCGQDNANPFDEYGNPSFCFSAEYHLCDNCTDEWREIRPKSKERTRTPEGRDEFEAFLG